MKVLLSIKPEFAEKIFNGLKKYEFRRTLFKRKDIKTVFVYASSPIKKVIGEFEIESILTDEIKQLWNKTKDYSGIDEKFYLSYFSGKKKGYALKIKKATKYKNRYDIKKYFGVSPPQSFVYISDKHIYIR